MSDPKDRPVIENVTDLNQGDGEPGFTRVGPILDVERFKLEYLFGIPLVAALTGEQVSDQTLHSFIRKGISDFETSVRIAVSPTRIEEKFDYERADDIQFGTRRFKRWPVQKVEKLEALWPGRIQGQEVAYPTSWAEIEPDTGVLRIVPRSGTDVNADTNFLRSTGYQGINIGRIKHWPGMWKVTYIAGFEHDRVPDIVNDLIGTLAAIKFLSQMGPAIFPVNSFSIGLDGLSQGSANAGPQWLGQRMQDLQAQADRLIPQLKSHYATDIQLFAF